ncbi:hypothetical protein SEA_ROSAASANTEWAA_30 [Streptomyces phage RosaAsantewaa]|nr:hypothetical protein SEA_ROSAASANTEWAA_30 [Streptomyces phage RosaAsantewaa]
MDFSAFFKRAGKVAADNSPAILTAIGVTGTLTTAYLVGKASFKAAEVLAQEQASRDEEPESQPLELQDKIELTWKLYVPSAGIAALTVLSIVGANHIGSRRAAALASAYQISEKAFAEYKRKVIDKMGEKKEQAVRAEVAQDRVNANPVSQSTLIVTKGGNTRCLDLWTNRYFTSDVESIRKAQNDINQKIINENYASLTDFWDLLGIPATTESSEIGWTTDELLDVNIDAAIGEDNEPVITMAFRATPVRGYYNSY